MTMKCRKITLVLTTKKVCIRALVNGCLGLHRHIYDPAKWCVSHLPTGKLVGESYSKHVAKAYVRNYGNESLFKSDCADAQSQDAIRLSLNANFTNPAYERIKQ